MEEISDSEWFELFRAYRSLPKDEFEKVYKRFCAPTEKKIATRVQFRSAMELYGHWPPKHAMEGAGEYDEIMASQEAYGEITGKSGVR